MTCNTYFSCLLAFFLSSSCPFFFLPTPMPCPLFTLFTSFQLLFLLLFLLFCPVPVSYSSCRLLSLPHLLLYSSFFPLLIRLFPVHSLPVHCSTSTSCPLPSCLFHFLSAPFLFPPEPGSSTSCPLLFLSPALPVYSYVHHNYLFPVSLSCMSILFVLSLDPPSFPSSPSPSAPCLSPDS
jgi:hypothetical protein